MADSDTDTYRAILDGISHAIVFADSDHIIRFANKAAFDHYRDRLKPGSSLLDCHNEQSKQRIREIYRTFENGENECVYRESESRRLIMFAVRDAAGNLMGYAERIENISTR